MKKQDYLSLLASMQDHASVSGMEHDLSSFLKESLPFPFEKDEVDNLFTTIRGNGKEKISILVDAHMDEIGFIIADITDSGFFACQTIGGIHCDFLPGSKVTVFGKEPFSAVIGSRPPHLSKINSEEKHDGLIYVTAGFKNKAEAAKFASIGDAVHLNGAAEYMGKDRIVSRGLDNKVSVLAILDALHHIKTPYHDVTILFSVGEETTGRGVRAFTNHGRFDMALVLDTGFGKAEGISSTQTITLGKGPSVSITERDHIGLAKRVASIARKNQLPCQWIAEPGGTGTNSGVIQIRHGGIPTVVVSIPILNMHTASEIVDVKDIQFASKLIAVIASEENVLVGKKVCYV